MSDGQLIQITRRRLAVERVSRGEQPVYETKLEDHQQIIGVAFEWERDDDNRKTVDHFLTVYVASRFNAVQKAPKKQ